MTIPSSYFSGSCVSSKGRFIFGIHKPYFNIANLRERDFIVALGNLPDNTEVNNNANFPKNDAIEENADIIYEIPNPFPFRGTTYINSSWADKNAAQPEEIKIEKPKPFSFKESMKTWLEKADFLPEKVKELYKILPRPVIIAIADSSTDPDELIELAKNTCSFVYDNNGRVPVGLLFKKDGKGRISPDIKDHALFEIIANNQYLPDAYKNAMVLSPGIQGTSEITGDKHNENNKSHVFEYLRRNSYIPWGHFAANMANNSVRYSAGALSLSDMEGMRHLYYQRTYLRLAEQLDIQISKSESKKSLSQQAVESLRLKIIEKLSNNTTELKFDRSLWGWNYGFGYSHSDYNLHASHQQIHQQYAMIPKHVSVESNVSIRAYSSGDLVEDFVQIYRKKTGKNFFKNYIAAINSNTRTDGNFSKETSLIVFEDENILVFVPKAQVSQFELQLMPKKQCGNVLEANFEMRKSIDKAILISIQTLESLGAKMVTSIEFSKRFDLNSNHDQNIIYSFLPKLPMSPGAFSEAQLRWINGHYPEDFAIACRGAL